MRKVRFYYNLNNLQYEKYKHSPIQKALRVCAFLSVTIIFAAIIVYVSYTYFDSPEEKVLRREIKALTFQYNILDKDLTQMSQVLTDVRSRDDDIYRVIFESEPIPSTIREVGYGGANLYKKFEDYDNGKLMSQITKKVKKIRRQLYIQSKSFDEIEKMLRDKKEMLASIPAIQPVYNKDLRRMASGFGYRIDPIYKTRKFHEGMDFTAPTGTPIYATGNGKVKLTKVSYRGYGIHVILDHDYGYKTLYAHMKKFIVKSGQKVTRGQIIGYVGSTGKSTAPHLHYEVLKNNKKVNPINFYYSDLTPEQYKKITELAAVHNQSFD